MSGHMGNPAPIGLMAFACSIFMLGALNAGLVDKHFKELITTFGFWWAGLGQVSVGLFELLHGNTFGALVFWTYGSLWMALSTVWFYARQNEYNQLMAHHNHIEKHFGYVGAHHYKGGEALMLIIFALVTLFFFVISLRKNRALQVCLGILFFTMIFLAIGEFEDACKKIGGWGCMITGLSAFYILMAEIVNEEWGYAVVPGIAPVAKAKHVDDFKTVFSYDKGNNTVFINLAGCHFLSTDTVSKFEAAMDKEFGALGQKAHVTVNYKGVEISPGVEEAYAAAVHRLQDKHYLSVNRFMSSAFRNVDTGSGKAPDLRRKSTFLS